MVWPAVTLWRLWLVHLPVHTAVRPPVLQRSASCRVSNRAAVALTDAHAGMVCTCISSVWALRGKTLSQRTAAQTTASSQQEEAVAT